MERATIIYYHVFIHFGTKLDRACVKQRFVANVKRVKKAEERKLKDDMMQAIINTQKNKKGRFPVQLLTFNSTARYDTYYSVSSYDVISISYREQWKEPPSYIIMFSSILAPNWKDDIDSTQIENMRFKMLKTDKLLYHALMNDGETMLFIRSDYDMYSDDAKGIERSPESVTKIILSSSKILKERQAPLKELKRGKVLLVSYCASQQMFAILIRRKWTHELRFMRYQRGCIQFTNKTNDLSKTNWWRER
eukprot:1014678_1